MIPIIVVLNEQSQPMVQLMGKLKDYGFSVETATTPAEALDKIATLKPRLFIASGDSQELDLFGLAEKVFDVHSIPSFLVLASAGDTTQNRIIRHPGIIGVFFSPLNVEKLYDRIRKFFEMMDTPRP